MNFAGVTIDIDTGGTFTDGFITAGDRVELVKVDTTPHDLTVCFINCIDEAARRLDLSTQELLSRTAIIRYSTTVGTNTLLQKKGPKLGLIVTEGYADSLYSSSGKDEVPDSEDLMCSVVPPGMRVGLGEQIDDKGNATRPLDKESVRQAVEHLLDSGARSIVISLKNSAVNAAHERSAKAIIDSEYPRHYLGSVRVLPASSVTSHHDNHVRTCTAVLNAYVHRDMVRYLYRADELLRQRGYRRPLLVVHSSGGAARVAKTTALNTYNSGPAAGFIGCGKVASELYGTGEFVSVDVGGTSVDIGVCSSGKIAADREPSVEGVRIGIPMVTLGTAAGGGGSIARADFETKDITVGPESAGALPGPVAYDLGGMEPTVTDADLALGYLNPDYFLGGKKKLNKDKSAGAIDSLIASSLGITVEEAAWRIVQSSEDDVAQQIRESVERKGLRPETLTMFAFGGGGGTRCCGYASRLGISRIIVFPFNAAASAFGASTMDILHLYERPIRITLRDQSGAFPVAEWKPFGKAVSEMVSSAQRDMRGEGFSAEQPVFTIELAIRSARGLDFIESPLIFLEREEEARELADLHASSSGRHSGELLIENVTLKAVCPTHHYELPRQTEEGHDPKQARKGTRHVYWGRESVETDIYERDRLRCGNRIEGPAIIESPDTTYVVPPQWTYTVDKYLNGILEVGP